MPTKSHSGLDTEIWGESGVNLALRATKHDLNSKGRIFNPFIVNYNPNVASGEKELERFAQEFNRWYPSVVEELGDDEELCLSLAIGSAHWTAVHIVLSKNAAPFIFSLDAADDSRGASVPMILARGIPIATVRHLEQLPIKLPNGEEQFRRIQSSNTGCSRMTPWHLSVLSRMNVRELLADVELSLTSSQEAEWLASLGEPAAPSNFGKISPENLPAELAPIFKITQNFAHVVTLPVHLLQSRVNVRGETLLSYCQKRQGNRIAFPFSGVMATKEADMKKRAHAVKNRADKLDVFDFMSLDKEGRLAYLKAQRKEINPYKIFLKQVAEKFQQTFTLVPPPPTIPSSQLTY